MVNSLDFGNRLQKILDFYNISATELSNQISFNRSTISHLLSGRNKPSLDFVMKVLQKFPEVELYWLLNGKGSFPDKNETKTPSLFLHKTTPQKFEKVIAEKKETIVEEKKEIEKIVIFYKNGTFKSYTP